MNNKEFAVIQINSKQFIVTEGQTLVLDRVSTKSNIQVLLVNTGSDVLIGDPFVEDAGVSLEIIDDKKDKKISVRRFKSKSRYRKHKGHRQPISVIKVKKFGVGVKNEVVLNLKENTKEGVKETSTDSEINSEKKKTRVAEEKVDKKKKSELLVKDVEGISETLKEKLAAAGYDTVEKIKKASDEELTSLKGVGQKAVDKLRESIK